MSRALADRTRRLDPARRVGARALALAAVAALVPACGASIQALYEGDVRFEHCMALDSRPDVKPTIRRACWEEWNRFYTFGQTRDRVDYARLRTRQLSNASDFDEGEWASGDLRKAAAVPDPTSALAPPPMMLAADGGVVLADGGAEAGAIAQAGDDRAPSADCAGECEETFHFCKQECKSPACDKTCNGKYKRCMRRCF